MNRADVAIVAIIVYTAGLALAQGCSPQNWKTCQGKPWVIGATMDTPIGAKWWPNALWGAGDEAGATNWYTQPEVIQRALAGAKRERPIGSAAPTQPTSPRSPLGSS